MERLLILWQNSARGCTMNTNDMRDALKKAPKYNHTSKARDTWSTKVDRMSDKQVMAIYFRMLRGGELNG